MSDCCDEPGCRRRQPIHLYLGDFSGTVWAATRWRKAPGVLTDTMIAKERHDVTRQMREFIRRNPQWVRTELEEADRG